MGNICITALLAARVAPDGGGSLDGEYIEVIPPESDVDVFATLVSLIRPVSARTVRTRPLEYPTLVLGEGVRVILDLDPTGQGTVLLALEHARGDAAARHSVTKTVYDALVASTTWPVRWTSDKFGELRETDSRGWPVVVAGVGSSGKHGRATVRR